MNRKLICVNGQLLDFREPRIMGILNVTPDSFFADSRFSDQEAIEGRIGQMVEEGVDILDIGGYSTRPGAAEVSVQEELDRVLPAVQLAKEIAPDLPVSVDTFRARVASESVRAGAGIINDVSGGTLDDDMFDTVAELQVPYILMHMRGTPETMQSLAKYRNVLPEVLDEIQRPFSELRNRGLRDIVIDPGLGFAKTVEQNFELLQNLEHFRLFEAPVLVGLSRKSFIWKTLGKKPDEILSATSALHAVALLKKADILRVHDVKEAVEVRKLLNTNCLGL
ncbi:dihydropteroate synthase [Marinilongibacter aquaticus]|uniref:dihydropteroate synthase n=1 Tax=Marinilongibacter aquaticus TaxID=2975157 RepID=UPI0021BD0B57|nr:dihydropteroate synthase [Marinilongibacter aquaticus]UBM58425.1 dihydropteroate synthase [Marinilongibacter aquaticus]